MSSDNVQQIKDALAIEEVIGGYVKLERAGKNMKARCPFHNEKTPSFYVTPDRNMFKCFGCGKGGDVFSFVQEIEGLDFYGSLKLLAQKAGITLTSEQRQGSNNSVLYDIMDTAQKFYEVQLRKTPQVIEYLLARGLTKDTLKNFHVGYAPSGWDNLYKALRGKGFNDADIARAGLSITGKKSPYDRFRERIMFPIADTQGRTVAFSGRIFTLPDSKTDTTKVGKYVNSPEGVLYDKSKVLYGYAQAKRTMLSALRVVVVEGQIDLLMAHQAGTTESVALSGTALTAEHCKLIKRFTDTILLALDGDEAGLKAAERSVIVGYEQDMDVQVVLLPEGKDPADVIEGSPDAWQELLTKAKDYLDVRLTHLTKTSSPRVQDRLKEVRAHIFPFIQYVANPVYHDAYLQKIGNFLGVSAEVVREEYGNWYSKQTPSDFSTSSHRSQANLLGREKSSPPQQGGDASSATSVQDTIVGLIEWLRSFEVAKMLEPFIERYNTIADSREAYEKYREELGPLLDELVTRTGVKYETTEHGLRALPGALNLLELSVLQEKRQTLRANLRGSASPEETRKHMAEIDVLNKQIDEVKGKMNE